MDGSCLVMSMMKVWYEIGGTTKISYEEEKRKKEHKRLMEVMMQDEFIRNLLTNNEMDIKAHAELMTEISNIVTKNMTEDDKRNKAEIKDEKEDGNNDNNNNNEDEKKNKKNKKVRKETRIGVCIDDEWTDLSVQNTGKQAYETSETRTSKN